MALFTIKDQNDNQPIVETHYYNWLKDNGFTNIHNIQTKTQYLTEQGFNVGVDRISSEEVSRLKLIENYYYKKVSKKNN